MSFVIAFAPFLRVEIDDDAGAPVAAFTFAPTARTRKAMADHAILFRTEASGFTLYYKTNPTAVPPLLAPIAARTRFSFAMTLTEPGFFDRYHPASGGANSQILLDNLDAAGAIATAGTLSEGATVEAADLIAAGPTRYPLRLDVSGGAPTVVEAQDRFTNAVVGSTDIVVEPTVAEIFTSVDTTGATDAALRLVAPAPSTLDRLIYADDAIADGGAIGVIDLYWNQPQDAVPAGTGAVFTATFRRRP
jgi:hypothetical protein